MLFLMVSKVIFNDFYIAKTKIVGLDFLEHEGSQGRRRDRTIQPIGQFSSGHEGVLGCRPPRVGGSTHQYDALEQATCLGRKSSFTWLTGVQFV